MSKAGFVVFTRASLPLGAFNLEYDLVEVLKPKWQWLRISRIGSAGPCALRPAPRRLDPAPAGNCQLPVLRQYYRLSERGAHAALGGEESSRIAAQQETSSVFGRSRSNSDK